jgi:HYR domain
MAQSAGLLPSPNECGRLRKPRHSNRQAHDRGAGRCGWLPGYCDIVGAVLRRESESPARDPGDFLPRRGVPSGGAAGCRLSPAYGYGLHFRSRNRRREVHLVLRGGYRSSRSRGMGAYQGASGRATVARSLSAGHGSEWWTGTEFDITPPTIAGAVAKSVRAPKTARRVRVTYKVTASDAVDGQVPVTCLPRSGGWFPIGRTLVTCQARDKSGNTGRARFAVTVRRR